MKSSRSAKSTRIAKPCSNDTGPECRSSETYESFVPTPLANDAEKRGVPKVGAGLAGHVHKSTSLPAASPASLFPTQESEAAQRMTATSGRKWFAAYRSSSPFGLLVKTLLASTRWRTFSSRYILTWKGLGTKFRRSVFQLVPSERTTDGSDGGFWPTPRTSDANGASGVRVEKMKDDEETPSQLREDAEYRTGRVVHGRSPGPSASGEMFPTPRAFMWKDSMGNRSDYTPSNIGEYAHQNYANTNKSGRLSVAFVEWLTGYPPGWTDVEDTDPSETEPTD